MRSYDHRVGVLSVDGEVRGHLACLVHQMTFPSRGPWPWFRVVWVDGRREPVFEDYGPGWWTIRELESGRFESFGPSTPVERRFLGVKFWSFVAGEPIMYDFAWLDREAGTSKWNELGLTEGDF